MCYDYENIIFNTKHILYTFFIFSPATRYEVEGNVTFIVYSILYFTQICFCGLFAIVKRD